LNVVINSKYGGFGISDFAFEKLIELGWKDSSDPLNNETDILILHTPQMEYFFSTKWRNNLKELRTHKDLISVVEELGQEANGDFANLKVIEIPDDVDWDIDDCEGKEWVFEKHRYWD